MRTSPDTHYMSRVDVFNFVLKLLSVCGVCSSEQLAVVYAYRDKPLKRMWDVLKYLRDEDYVESKPFSEGRMSVHRLSRRVRRQYGLKSVRWDSNLEHKLAITDLYLALSEPEYFMREYRQPFMWNGKVQRLSPDACATLPDDRIAFFEIQRTPIETKKWAAKRQLYERYFASGAWMDVFPEKPMVIVIQSANQQLDTIGTAIGYDLMVMDSMDELSRIAHAE